MTTTQNKFDLSFEDETSSFLPVKPSTYNALVQKFNTLAIGYSNKDHEYTKLETMSGDLKNSYDTLKADTDKLLFDAHQWKNDLSERVDTLTSELNSAKMDSAGLSLQLLSAANLLDETKEQNDRALADYKELTERQMLAKEDAIKGLQERLQVKASEYTTLESTVSGLKSTVSDLNTSKAMLENEVGAKVNQIAQLATNYGKLSDLMDKEYNPINSIVPEISGGSGNEAYWDLMVAIGKLKEFSGKTSINKDGQGSTFRVSVDIGDAIARVEKQVYCNGITVSLNGYSTGSSVSSTDSERSLSEMKTVYAENKTRVRTQKRAEKMLATGKDPKKIEKCLNELDTNFTVNATVDYESVEKALGVIRETVNGMIRIYQVTGSDAPEQLYGIAQIANRWQGAEMTGTSIAPTNDMIAFESARQVYLNNAPLAPAQVQNKPAQKSIYEQLGLVAGKLI